MALLCVSKKKIVVKRAWKRFTHKLRSKSSDIKIAVSVRDSTSRLLRVISHHLIVPFRTRYLQNTIPRIHFNIGYSHHHSHFLEFFSRPFGKRKCPRRDSESIYRQIYQYESQRWRQGETKSDEKVVGRKKEKKEEEGPQEIVDSMEDAWMRVVAASPHLRVDEKADQFINKFREAMRLDKERSLLEFQERLLHGWICINFTL
ncbi:hypothetical protein IGI04_026336 [Brassica rapa subsp. trilocularis]|uniref:Uncharacterized protein n=1 Tax=Brassica rapa subsp. trilocularis TaxID=1813537 RepID=A0ABQ7KYU0_BRACM|nr:hypothetical protein IGI04_026336 [Brassica rapa subsp. trilocularis]